MKNIVESFMRRTLHTMVATLLLLSGKAAAGEKNGLAWVSFDKGLAEAKQVNKKVLIDVYTDWCGWCKKMDVDTYNDAGVASYLKAHYVLVKLNGESDATLTYRGTQYTERELAAGFSVSGYPTTIFLKSNGDPITTYPGFADASKFRAIISFIAEEHYRSKKFEEYMKSQK